MVINHHISNVMVPIGLRAAFHGLIGLESSFEAFPENHGLVRNMSGQFRNMSGHVRNMSGQVRKMSGQVRTVSGQVRNMSSRPRFSGKASQVLSRPINP